jgi:hypothetical protein
LVRFYFRFEAKFHLQLIFKWISDTCFNYFCIQINFMIFLDKDDT